MEQISNLCIDVRKFDIDSIVYVKPNGFMETTKNLSVYFKKKEGKKNVNKKIIVKTPKMSVPYAISHFINKYGKHGYQLSLSFKHNPTLYNEKCIKDFHNFIKDIDSTNRETITSNWKAMNLPKGIEYLPTLKKLEKGSKFMNLELRYSEKGGFITGIFDERGDKSGIEIIEKGCIVQAVIEMTDIIFTNRDTCYCNWNVMQLRKFPPYAPIQEYMITKCILFDEDNPNDDVFDKRIQEYLQKIQNPMQYLLSLHAPSFVLSSSPLPPPPPPPPPLLKSLERSTSLEESIKEPKQPPPSLEEILAGKNKLKKVKTVVKTATYGTVI